MKVGSVEKLSAVGFNRVTGLFKPAVVYSYVTTHGKAWQKPLMLKPGKSSEKFFAYVFQQPNSIVASQTKYEVTTKQRSVGKSQILSSRCLLANLKYYQADDVTSHKRLSYLERLCFAIPCFRIVFGGDSSSVRVGR